MGAFGDVEAIAGQRLNGTILSWEQKLQALMVLDTLASLCMRRPGDWYISCRLEIGANNSGVLVGALANGQSPHEAVVNLWQMLTDTLPKESYIVTRGTTSNERHYRWNGFMWQELSFTPTSK